MWEPGATVLDGRFRIHQALGVTSGTEDYVAEQVSLARKVALRVIRPELGVQPDAEQRFEKEVRRLAQVDHPNVVRVIDSGRADGKLYLVTELAEGPLLSAELKGVEPLMPERALEMLTQVAEGLHAVHEKGLVHGELTPRCIVAGSRARLLGFGVARLLDAENPAERVTMVTRAITAPEYLAPEQLKGKDADPKTDVFALGAVAFRALSGAMPFDDPQHVKVKPLAQAAGHLADQHGLSELVGRCLDAEPKRRPDARELAQKLAKLPRPAEPTLFLESMQRPPELPGKSAGRAADLPTGAPRSGGGTQPQPKPAAPPELLKSVPMLTLTPAEPPKALPPPLPSRPQPRSRWPMLLGGAALLGAVALAAANLTTSPAGEARKLIENRQPAQALEVLTKALRKGQSSELTALRAAALHLSEAHHDEELTFKSLPADAKEALDPLVLSGIVEDFGRKEETSLRAALKALPQLELKGLLEKLAHEPVSPRQWGALRYLDLENQAQGLKLVDLYSVSLESNSCPVRKLAARRLQELDDDTALDALNRLKELPREGSDKACGQDEAAQAAAALKKLR